MFRYDLIKKAVDREGLVIIAERSGVSQNTVARIRDGENVSLRVLAAVAAALGLRMRDLFEFPAQHKAEQKKKAAPITT